MSVDCETCKNFNTYTCDDCEHNYTDLEDLYEPISPEEMAKIEEKERQKRIASAITEWIELELTEEFRNAFNKVQKFTAYTHFRDIFMAVKVDDEAKHLIASDTHVLSKIPCHTIPEILVGKLIYKIEGNLIGATDAVYPDYELLFAKFNNDNIEFLSEGDFTFGEIKEKEPGELAVYTLPFFLNTTREQAINVQGEEVFFNAHYLELIKESLTGVMRMAYIDKFQGACFKGDDASVILMPLRKGC